MKNINLCDLEKKELLALTEPLAIKNNGNLVGIYYPVVNHQEVKKTKEKLDLVMKQVLAETGLTEDEYISMFFGANEELCV